METNELVAIVIGALLAAIPGILAVIRQFSRARQEDATADADVKKALSEATKSAIETMQQVSESLRKREIDLTAEQKVLQDKISELEKKLEETKCDLAATRGRLEVAERKISDLECENEELKKKLAGYEEKNGG